MLIKATLQKTTPFTPYQGELEGRHFSFEITFIVNEEHEITRFEKNPFLDPHMDEVTEA